MSATIVSAVAPAPARSFAGLGSLVRKERTEWLRGRRAWVVLVLTTVLMSLFAAAAWINTTLRTAFPSPDAVPTGPVSMAPMDNLLVAINSQIFIFVTIFAVAGLILRERDTGTLAWLASKPISRRAIIVAKWAGASVMLAITAAVVPLAVTAAVVAATYGAPNAWQSLLVGAGMVATVAFYAAVGLALGTMLPSQAAVAGAAIGVHFLPVILGAVPLPLTQLLPNSILAWSMGLAGGQDVGFVTPVAWLVGTVAIVAFGARRTEQLEL